MIIMIKIEILLISVTVIEDAQTIEEEVITLKTDIYHLMGSSSVVMVAHHLVVDMKKEGEVAIR